MDFRASKQALFEISRSSLGSSDSPSPTDSPSLTASVDSNELLALYEMAEALTGNGSLSDAGDVIGKHLKRVVPFELCVFFIYDKQNDDLIGAYASGDRNEAVLGIRITLGERLAGWVAANRQTIMNSDPALDLVGIVSKLYPRLRATLATPLMLRQDLVGVLALYSDVANIYTDDHRRVIEVLARQIAPIVLRAAERETNRRKILTDRVTGLPNMEYLRRLFAPDCRFGGESFYPLTVLLVDVGQRQAAEAHGRSAADQLMGHVATAIRRSLRGADILFRYCEDEFVILLTKTDLTVADQVTRRIVDTAACLKVAASTREALRIGVRVGGAMAPADGTSLESLVETARQRLEPWTFGGSAIPLRGASIH
jgi:diguanylate cyclase (GGDEF)-like protein